MVKCSNTVSSATHVVEPGMKSTIIYDHPPPNPISSTVKASFPSKTFCWHKSSSTAVIQLNLPSPIVTSLRPCSSNGHFHCYLCPRRGLLIGMVWHGVAWCGMVWYSGLLIGRPQSFLSFSSNPTKYRPQPQGNYSFQNSLSQNLRNCQNAAKVKPKLWF